MKEKTDSRAIGMSISDRRTTPINGIAPIVAKTIEHYDSKGQHRKQKDKSKILSLPIISEPSITDVSHRTSGQEKHKLRTSSLPISLDPTTIGIPISTHCANQDFVSQRTQTQTNLASKDILPQQT